MSGEAGASPEPGKGDRAAGPVFCTPQSSAASPWSPQDVPVSTVTTATPQPPLLPHGFPPSLLFLYGKGVSGSQFSHNFSPGLQLLTRGASPPTLFPRPGAAPPVSPAPPGNRRNQLSKTALRETDTQISQRPGPCGLWMDWGRGHRRRDRRKEILLPNALPRPTPPKTSAAPGANF